MRIIFLSVVLLHGFLHLLGFVKGFGLKEVSKLTLPISKPMGFLWLSAAILLFIFIFLHSLNSQYAWLAGLTAAIFSQILIILFWKDAKFGTLPNIPIFLVSLALFGHYNFQRIIHQETGNLLGQNKIVKNNILNKNDIEHLPQPVKNWLRTCGIIGKQYISIGKVTQIAAIKMEPEQEDWMQATAVQYTTINTPAFIWTVDMKMNSILYVLGRDKFENGKGEMLIKMNALISLVDEKGEKLDEGTLQRYLGEMVWFPSLALSPYVTWEQVNDTTAKAIMTYKGITGSGVFHFNNNGDIIKLSALRYKGNEAAAKRYNWTMDITDYKIFEGIKVPSEIASTWELDEGNWTWLKLEVTDIKYNENVNTNN